MITVNLLDYLQTLFHWGKCNKFLLSGDVEINVRNVNLILTQLYYYLYRNGLPPINLIQRIFFNKPSTVQKTLASKNSKIDGTEEKHDKKMKELRKSLTKLENEVLGTRNCNIQRSSLKKRNHRHTPWRIEKGPASDFFRVNFFVKPIFIYWHCELAFSVIYNQKYESKNVFLYRWVFWKSNGWRIDFRGPNLFWKRGIDCIMSSSNADLSAVSLAYPKDPKSPYSMGPPS